jgi:PhnB protein
MAQPIPKGFHSITPYLTVDDAAAAIDFYKSAFGAEEVMRLEMGDVIGHAEVKIGDSHLMLADEWPDYDKLSPKTRGGPTAAMTLYVEDCDGAFQRAVDAGATSKHPVQDQFYGDRSGTVTDPFGHEWTIATHKEDLSTDTIQRRMHEMMAAQA